MLGRCICTAPVYPPEFWDARGRFTTAKGSNETSLQSQSSSPPKEVPAWGLEVMSEAGHCQAGEGPRGGQEQQTKTQLRCLCGLHSLTRTNKLWQSSDGGKGGAGLLHPYKFQSIFLPANGDGGAVTLWRKAAWLLAAQAPAGSSGAETDSLHLHSSIYSQAAPTGRKLKPKL